MQFDWPLPPLVRKENLWQGMRFQMKIYWQKTEPVRSYRRRSRYRTQWHRPWFCIQ